LEEGAKFPFALGPQKCLGGLALHHDISEILLKVDYLHQNPNHKANTVTGGINRNPV